MPVSLIALVFYACIKWRETFQKCQGFRILKLDCCRLFKMYSLHNSAELKNFRLAAKQRMLSNWG